MLESSWGEKFSKMIKNAVSSGLNKVEIMLKPKNLGKLNIDISIKENSTKININAENQESANLLNENLTKINDLIENRNEKLSNSFDNNNNNFFSDQKRQKKPNHEHTINKKKTIENSTKTSIGNHNIDVQA
jgi:flagellar hook-length control protein FliK